MANTDKTKAAHIIVGSLLKTHREEQGITQKDIATDLELRHSNFVSMFESGKTPVPLGKLTQVLRAYQMPKNLLPAILKSTNLEAYNLLTDILEARKDLIGLSKKEINEKIDKEMKDTLVAYGLEGLAAIQSL